MEIFGLRAGTEPERSLRLVSVVGTRPEAIKIAPFVLAARKRPTIFHRTIATGQHGRPFDDALAAFGIEADVRMAPSIPDPSPDVAAERLLGALGPVLSATRPDMVLVQGDTTTAYAAALAAHRLGLAIGHIEAGLRSFDLESPWPEERNRVVIDRLSALLFAPTENAAINLEMDDQVHGQIFMTGNTGIDALLTMKRRIISRYRAANDDRALIFLTCHRRENFGAGIEGICKAALRLADRGDIRIVCPVHPNPAVKDIVVARLAGHPAITLMEPLPYAETVRLMASSRLILTDSGGIQEEAPALGIPTLVLRDVTERPEAEASGNLALIGTDPDRIVSAASQLLDDPAAHAAMARPAFPFGRGDASLKILDHIEHYFSRGVNREHPLPFEPVWTKHAALQGV